jgi:hypothetical protein
VGQFSSGDNANGFSGRAFPVIIVQGFAGALEPFIEAVSSCDRYFYLMGEPWLVHGSDFYHPVGHKGFTGIHEFVMPGGG